MPRTFIRVHVLDSTNVMVGTPPVPKWKDQENGVRSVDFETGAPLFTLTLFLMESERAEALKVAVPQTGLPNGLHPGRFVRPVDLFASPWARINKDQLQEGVAYRCAALELVAAPQVPQDVAVPEAAEA
ncbi:MULTISPECIES: hypothetical protein [unclassified Streptomyces]|uniref:hypothetical protein n=1 Tax=unclassified Streptomyces TaxID=2593676 RepID=UPI0033AE6564|nr:hypothetical protein OH719_25495 [Streptomyces sp. NBC_01653]WTD89948.1 hypothetical protein OG891_21375 [Streptomyces sp. NBC_01637]